MNIILNTQSKSLSPFQKKLPDFVILTGLNGAGKTQLLVAAEQNLLQIFDDFGKQITSIKYIPTEKLVPNQSVSITREQLNKKADEAWKAFKSVLPQYKNHLTHIGDISIANLINLFNSNVRPDQKDSVAKVIVSVIANANKSLDDIDINDFFEYYPIDADLDTKAIFYQNFSSLFKRYHDKLDENQYREFMIKSKGIKNISFLSDEAFVETYGNAPWDFVNDIIKEAKLDYHVNSPIGTSRDAPFEFRLVHNLSNASVNFNDLSSGEKVLMSLALALYNSKADVDFPKVLLLDEPDAFLHPSMSRQFLSVVDNIFVKQKGISVIVTTHSPSTIALAPEEAIFIVNKTGERVEKASKDKALKILTSGVPSFSVLYENRRQVFVESPNDVKFYEGLYQRLTNYLNQEISLTFISSGESRTDKNGIKISNCGQVENIVSILRRDNNIFIWGIIDWDAKNVSDEYVKVIGDGNRYSIESYLLDPLLIGAFLLREKMVTKEEMGLSTGEDYNTLLSVGSRLMQIVSDYVVNKVKLKSEELSLWNTKPIDISLRIMETVGKAQMTIPTWYLHYQGHKLEDLLIRTFPKLGAVKRDSEEALKLEIIRKVVDDYPEMVSMDFVKVFRAVQQL